MSKNKAYGKPYTKPISNPTFRFLSMARDTVVEAYETVHNVEVYQIQNGKEQRIVMPPSQFDNFYNLLLNNGFIKA
jgi:hypothetical protein